jgi:hypothetical protein
MDGPAGFKPFFKSSMGVQHFRRVNADGTVSYAASQDVEPLLDRNKAMANENDGYDRKRELRRVASIPPVVILKLKAEHGIDVFNPDHADALARILNDPDYLYLRTAPGRIGYSNGVLR